MTQSSQLQRLSLDKNLFWNCVMSLNENGGYSFFDVRIKKGVQGGSSMIGLQTSDIPPFPLSSTDTIKVQFVLENNMGLTTQRHLIGEASITGTELVSALEAQGDSSKSITVQTETGEWQFQLLEKVWVLRSVLIYVPSATLKALVKDL